MSEKYAASRVSNLKGFNLKVPCGYGGYYCDLHRYALKSDYGTYSPEQGGWQK